MYETAKDLEEKEKALQEKKMNKRKIIDTIVILILVAIAGIFIYSKRDRFLPPKTEKPKEEEPVKEVVKGYLDTSKYLDKVEIPVNDKKLEYVLLFTDDTNGPGIVNVKINNAVIYSSYAVDGISNVYYEVFTSAKDNKEYVYVSYDYFGTYGFIVNDSGTVIKRISEYVERAECYITTEEAAEKDTSLTTIKNGYVYYYTYKGFDLETDDDIQLHEIKVSVEDSNIKEEETGNTVPGLRAQCA